MKQWQARGEVLDSDDENAELSFVTQSPSPQRPAKRPKGFPSKLENDNFGSAQDLQNTTRTSSLTSNDGPVFLGRTELATPEADPSATQIGNKAFNPWVSAREPLRNGSSQQQSHHVELFTDQKLEQPPAACEPMAYLPSDSFTRDEQLSSVTTTLRSSEVPFGVLDVSQQIYAPNETDSPEQPIDLDRAVDGDSIEAFGNVSDNSSSILSERDVSPPPGFQFLNSATQVPAIGRGSGYYETNQSFHGKRKLRSRKEIQLHPYLLDRAEYLKQCRQRGMRPVRLHEQPQNSEGREDEFAVGGSERQASSSPIPPSSTAGDLTKEPMPIDPALNYFNNADRSSDVEPTSHRLPKRRRIFHEPSNAPYVSLPEVFHVPLSPPHTGSHAGTPRETTNNQRSSPHFRLPFGRAPVQLPTPQISSDVQGSGIDGDSSSDSLPQRRSRHSTAKKPQRPMVIASSSSATSSGEELEVVDKGLRREQRRMKGVLPASWLKLDLRKQQGKTPRLLARANMTDRDSPPKSTLQKGIAQKILPRDSRQTQRHHSLSSSDDDVGTDSEVENLELPTPLPLSRFGRQHLGSTRSQTMEDDAMENDWIDPMFLGASRPMQGKKKKSSKQPRITETFQKAGRLGENYSEERIAHPRPSLSSTVRPAKRSKSDARQKRRKSTAVHLSIVDAPQSPSAEAVRLPQFVRVALRHARRRQDRGRHSPTNKFIRMTTQRDTGEALSVLQAWRGGQMTRLPDKLNHSVTDQSNSDLTFLSSNQRRPLAECSGNQDKQTSESTSAPTVGRKGSSTGSSVPRRHVVQTRLNARVLHPATLPNSPAAASETPNRAQSGRTRQNDQYGLFPRTARLRGAQIETLAAEFNSNHQAAAFERRMQRLTEQAAKVDRRKENTEFRMHRFLHGEKDHLRNHPTQAVETLTNEQAGQRRRYRSIARPQKISRHSRKHRATRIDADLDEYRQSNERVPANFDDTVLLEAKISDSTEDRVKEVLCGLNPYGNRYPINFNIEPLDLGTYFRSSTFIGSGEFGDAFRISTRDLNSSAGQIRVHIGDQIMEWSSWTEDVAADLSHIANAIASALQSLNDIADDVIYQETRANVDRNVEYMLRSVSRYCSKCLWFVDPIDRQPCCDRLYRLVFDLTDMVTEHASKEGKKGEILVLIRQYCLVIAYQALQICGHQHVNVLVEKNLRQLVLHTGEALTRSTIPGGLKDLHTFYEDNRRSARREVGIGGEELTLITIVLLQHTLGSCGSNTSFWQMANSVLQYDISTACDVARMERHWYAIFTILPALEIDSAGLLKIGGQLDRGFECWALPRSLMARVLELYDDSCQVRGQPVNDYIRSLLSRCHLLVNKWRWWRCEQMLGIVYDFFARRGLAFLRNEESHGSPRFLERLTEDASLEIETVEADDRAFHIFLKVLATGLLGMRKHGIYQDRKIGSIAWRFIPSHGRTYAKDAELRTCDLDALRNHFDLLITLYFASPPGHRPRVELLRNLVDHNASHREACRLSVRAWTNAAAFQASTTESVAILQPLVDWFSDIIRNAIGQYRLARSEAEQEVEAAKEQGALPITAAVVEVTVAKNQRQIAATLVDALAGLKRVIQSASNLESVNKLTTETAFCAVLEVFDPSQRRLSDAVAEVLAIVNTTLDVQHRLRLDLESQQTSEDSQDFGDVSALQELIANDSPDMTVSQSLHNLISQFVSNMLGADESLDDGLNQVVIDVWVRLVNLSVQEGRASWTSYINDYSSHSWSRLRDTPQRRKFTPYFMARIVQNAGYDEEIRNAALTSWILSLVEREALLKYQHTLTSTLLNQYPVEPLLQNLPFIANHRDGQFHVAPSELRERRLGLLSSILSNMRQSCGMPMLGYSNRNQEVRMIYAGMLRGLMQTMKANYLDLQAHSDPSVADGGVQGSYVEFVQHVVSLLQQHSTELCPIDPFFTDSTAFPLPATDPTYVIGRLCSYVPKLFEAKTQKKLAVFVQTVSERAAVDVQQAYLVTQFAAAMTSDWERGNDTLPSLRHVLLTSVFPAYFEHVVSKECDWVLALPMLEASEHVLSGLLYKIDIKDSQCLRASAQMMHAMIFCVNQQFTCVLLNREISRRSQTYRTLTSMLNMAKACLTLADFVHRSSSAGGEVAASLRRLRSLCKSLEAWATTNADECVAHPADRQPASPWADTKTFATDQIRASLDRNWSMVNDRIIVQRGHSRKEFSVALQSSSQERDLLLESITRFCQSHDAVFDLRRRRRKPQPKYLIGVGGLDDMNV